MMMDDIKERLERLYSSFDFESAINRDPIRFPKRYKNPLDIEVVGIIASSFAYGKIACFCNFLEALFAIMGQNPADFLLSFNPSYLLKKLSFKYRFSTNYDIVAFLFILKKLLQQTLSGSLEHYFQSNDPLEGISTFVQSALKVDLKLIYSENIKPHGLLHFFPEPLKGSPCKRMNLFLRWMIRKKDVDLGLWKKCSPDKLIIPLDIHIWRVSKKLGFTKRNSKDIRTAMEITDYLRRIETEDPLKYDFVLCHGDINSLVK